MSSLTTKLTRKLLALVMLLVLALNFAPSFAVAAEAADASSGEESIALQASAVCQIGSTTYTSFKDAFKAVKSGQTIKLLADTTTGSLDVETSFTLDLNGHTLTRDTYGGFYNYTFYVEKDITFTITDSSSSKSGVLKSSYSGVQLEGKNAKLILDGGTIYADKVGVYLNKSGSSFVMNAGTIDAGSTGVEINDEATFTMNGGTITGAGSEVHSQTASYKSSGVELEHKGASFIMNNGTINTVGSAIYSKDQDTSVTIKNGTISSTKNSTVYIEAATTLTIQGGTFTANKTVFNLASGKSTLNISGGTFNGYCGIYDDSTTNKINITGGTFNSTGTSDIEYSNEDEAEVNTKIYGGKFSKRIKSGWMSFTDCSPSRLADGYYTPIKSSDATCVIWGEGTKQYTDALYYTSIYDAFNNDANKRTDKKVTITLLKNSTETKSITIPSGKHIVLNFSGETGYYPLTINLADSCGDTWLKVEGGLEITGDGEATIQGSGAVKNLFNVEGGNSFIYAYASNVTYKSSKTVFCLSSKGILRISGGTYKGGEADGAYQTIAFASGVDTTSPNTWIYGGTFTNYDPSEAPNTTNRANLLLAGYTVEPKSVTEGIDYTVTKGRIWLLDASGNFVSAYEKITDAISAANDGYTIRLKSNYQSVLEKTYEISNKSITLDLNNYQLYIDRYNIDESNKRNYIKVTDGGSFTVTDNSTLGGGEITSALSTPVIQVTSGGSLKVERGIIKSNYSYAVKGEDGAAIELEDGSFEGLQALAVDGSTDSSKISVKGGKYSSTSSSATSDIVGGSATKFVMGGLFAHEVPASQLADGYYCVKNDDSETSAAYPYKVVAIMVAQIGDVTYGSLVDAVAAVKSGETITMLYDVEEQVDFTGKDKVTLDLNGHTVNSAGNVITVGEGGSLTIADTSEGAAGKVSSTGTYNYGVVVSGSGSVEIKSGAVESTGPAAVATLDGTATGTITVSGGTLSGSNYAVLNMAKTANVKVSAGTLTGSAEARETTVYGAEGTVEVSGGIFNKAVPLEQCAAGYIPADGAEAGTYTVTAGYVIAFNTQGGAPEVETQLIKAGELVAKPENDPTREGYTFKGWYTAAEGGAAFNFATVPTADTTIYAQWEGVKQTFTVSFDVNGGDESTKPVDQTVEDGGTATKPATDPTRSGYIFKGWYTAAEDGNVFDFSTPIVANMTLYAQWSQAVASIGSTSYASLQDAVTAAQSGDTIKVLVSHSLPDTLLINNKDVTLDLGGCTVDFPNTETSGQGAAIYVYGGSLTVTDSSDGAAGAIGKVREGEEGQGQSNTAIPVALVDAKGFTLEKGSVIGYFSGLIVNNNDGTACDVTINGGSLISTFTTALGTFGPDVNVNITGGTLSGDSYAIDAASSTGNASLNITGGSFKSGEKTWSSTITQDIKVGSAEGFVSGGIFSKAVPLEQCAEGYYPTKNTDEATKDAYPYTVAAGSAVASITKDGTTTYYTSLSGAIAAADEGDTVKILQDIEIDEVIDVSNKNDLTLDLNGYGIDNENGAVFNLTGSTSLTISGGDGSSNYGYISGSNGTIVVNAGAALVLDDTAMILGQGTTATVTVKGGGSLTTAGTIKDGCISASGDSTDAISIEGEGATVAISGGEFASNAYVINDKGTNTNLSITGGDFAGESETDIKSGQAGFISGGKFDKEVPQVQCADGYVCVPRADGDYDVVKGSIVTFDENYEGGTTTMQSVKEGDKATKPETDPTRDGYTFAGWYTEAEGGDEFNFDETTISAATTIYAHWTKDATKVKKPEVKFVGDLVYNGSEQTGVIVPVGEGYIVTGDSAAAATNAGVYVVTVTLNDGCVWEDGTTGDISYPWYLAPKPATITVDDKVMVAGESMPELTGSVEGVCEGDDLKVTYKLEDGADTKVAGTYSILATSDAEEALLENYDFTVNEGTLTVRDAPVVTKVEKPDVEKAKVVGLEYNGKEQTGIALADSDYYNVDGITQKNAGTYTATISLKDKEATKWADGTTDDITVEWAIAKKAVTIRANNASMVAGGAVPSFTGEVEGVCAGDDLTVDYHLADDADTSVSGTYGIIPAWDAENSNYDVTAEAGTLTVEEVPTPPEPEVTYYTVLFQLNGGSTTDKTTQSVKENDCAPEPEAPMREGYTFDGWYTEAEGGNKFDFTTPITADTTLYAHWTQNITVVDIPEISENFFEYNAKAQSLNIPVSSNYEISGDISETYAGIYRATLTLKEGCEWSDGTTEPIDYYWLIAPASITITVDNKSMLVGEKTPELTGTVEGVCEGDTFPVSYMLGKDADTSKPGTYTITATWDEENINYDVAVNEGTLTVTAAPTPEKTKVELPALENFTYDGTEKTSLTVPDDAPYTVSGTLKATEPGTYTITLSLKDKENTVWASTGTSDDIELTWTIKAKEDPVTPVTPDPVSPTNKGGSSTKEVIPQTGDTTNTALPAALAAIGTALAAAGLTLKRRKE